MSEGFLLRKDDYPNGLQTQQDVQRLAALLNPYLTALNGLLANGATLTGTLECEVAVGTFAHNVPSQFSLKKLKSAKGCVVLGCDSAIPQGVTMQSVLDMRPEAAPRVNITVLFSNPAVTAAKVAILLLPEGQLHA